MSANYLNELSADNVSRLAAPDGTEIGAKSDILLKATSGGTANAGNHGHGSSS
jgi:hypothetical protein